MIAFLLLFYKSFQFLLILIICFIFANVGAGGPMYIYLFLLIVFNLSHNLNYKLINFKSYKYLDEVIISLIFITCVYLFIKFHLTIGLYFLFGCFFISLLIDIRKRKLLYILILIFSMTFPALMYKKKPYQQEWADIKSLFTLQMIIHSTI